MRDDSNALEAALLEHLLIVFESANGQEKRSCLVVVFVFHHVRTESVDYVPPRVRLPVAAEVAAVAEAVAPGMASPP